MKKLLTIAGILLSLYFLISVVRILYEIAPEDFGKLFEGVFILLGIIKYFASNFLAFIGKNYYRLFVLVLFVYLIYLSIRVVIVGGLRLSRDTRSYRRNILVIGFFIILNEAFGQRLKIIDDIGVSNEILSGLLGFIVIYSMVNFLFNIFTDVVSEKYRDIGIFAAILSLPMSGLRLVFDLYLPILTGAIVVILAQNSIESFSSQMLTYAEEELNEAIMSANAYVEFEGDELGFLDAIDLYITYWLEDNCLSGDCINKDGFE
ncbi:MAG: hypothetical protein Tsb002_33970 [Wenzhouxiangellaceae bacterium]